MADLTITTANVKPGATGNLIEAVTAGETITAGDALYQDSTTGKWMVGDCTNANKLDIERIALSGGADGEPISVIKPNQLVEIGATLVVAETYILSTDGKIAPIADLASADNLVVIGYGATTSLLDFRPYVTGYAKA